MSKKTLKFLMEMIFIFILPLLFILPAIKIINNYVYDNNGNFASSDKTLTYDSIGYSSYYNNYLDFNQYINYSDFTIADLNGVVSSLNNYNLILNGTNNGVRASDFNFIIRGSTNIITGHKYFLSVNSTNVIGDIELMSQFQQSGYPNFTSPISLNNTNQFVFVNNNRTSDMLEIWVRVPSSNTNLLSDVSINCMLIDLTKMFGSGYEPSTIDKLSNYIDLSVYHYYTESKEIVIASDEPIAENNNIVKSFLSNLKDLISNFLLIDNNNVVFNIVIDYTCLWFIMFVIWHLFYLLLDFLLHFWRKEDN